ncbi:hypothetical protein MKQ68_05500 [Chitinophaga horti]|uniref:Uncharacterized protein n=1 Tax=Chitinophaga horti TaxID=2920382 RepID=A0ABY6J4E0_9BACT|nr:hypothetical protein [Chitinophaga horti]UYQ94545.1 hypothetical protein MKQ68_05500 [Chitinophaga horti]
MKRCWLLIISVGLGSCGFYGKNFRPTPYDDGNAIIGYAPTGRKKEKTLTFPAASFTRALKQYRSENGAFPQELHILKSYNEKSRAAMQDMSDMGYTNMRITYLFLDSMEVDFVRVPKWTQDSDDKTMEMRILGKFIFTMRDSALFTNTIVY